MRTMALIRILAATYGELLSSYDLAPTMQFNFNDGDRQGTGDAPYMDDGLEDLEKIKEEIALTSPNTVYTGDQVLDSDINTGADELHKISNFKTSAPYFANSSGQLPK